MPTMSNWHAANGKINEVIDPAMRAIDAWKRIQMNPTTIRLFRLNTDQTFRVESNTGAGELSGPAATQAARSVILFGIRQHPTVTASNIQHKDRFVLGNTEYDVIDVLELPGEIQAFCTAVT